MHFRFELARHSREDLPPLDSQKFGRIATVKTLETRKLQR